VSRGDRYHTVIRSVHDERGRHDVAEMLNGVKGLQAQ
jgi:hypothetical protein